MRILTVEPGPEFSVADVHNGWLRALKRSGNEVQNFNLSDRITFTENAIRGKVPETEKGHIAARMVGEQLRATCFDFWPDLVILGGGVSKEHAKYAKWLTSRAPIVTATFLNTSGIIGAALAAGGHEDAPTD